MNEKLRAARIERHWSQEDAARAISVDRKTYNRWEKGTHQPQYGTLDLLCRAFQRRAEDLGFQTSSTSTKIAELPDEAPEANQSVLESQPSSDEVRSLTVEGPSPSFPDVFEQGFYLIRLASQMYQWSEEDLHMKVSHALAHPPFSLSESMNRRSALAFLAGVSGAVLSIPASSPLVPHAAELLPFCATNLAHCWQLGRGNRHDMLAARTLVNSYVPTLARLAQSPSAYQKTAADLVAQCYRLLAILGYHLETLAVAADHAEHAVVYSRLANEPNLLTTSLVLRGLIFFYAERPEKALEKCQEAGPYSTQASFAVQSYRYRLLAACQARRNQPDEARLNLELARQTFEQQEALGEVPYLHAAHDPFEMVLWEGITCSHLDQHTAAIDALERLNPLDPANAIPERVRPGFLNNRIFAELNKPAHQRDRDHCITLWQESMQSAIQLQSELRFAEASKALDGMVIAFPEPQVKRLRGSYTRWEPLDENRHP